MWPALGWSWLTKCFIEMDLKLAAPKTDWRPASFTLCQSYIRFTEKYLTAEFTVSNLKRELLGTILYNFSVSLHLRHIIIKITITINYNLILHKYQQQYFRSNVEFHGPITKCGWAHHVHVPVQVSFLGHAVTCLLYYRVTLLSLQWY